MQLTKNFASDEFRLFLTTAVIFDILNIWTEVRLKNCNC